MFLETAVRRSILPLLLAACAAGEDAPAGPAAGGDTPADGERALVGGTSSFGGGFAPRNAPYGGFGGGSCVATRTPIVFFPGNGDEAKNFDYPPKPGAPGQVSVYRTFRNAGYTDCEIFGVNYLSEDERADAPHNYMTADKAAIAADFVRDVLAYTGSDQVDVIAHSMGVAVSLHGLDKYGLWSSVRRYIAISASLRGLAACLQVGYANPALPTCGSQNYFTSDVFGFYPDTWYAPNPRLGLRGFRAEPARRQTRFYSLRAGYHDGFACGPTTTYPDCYATALFDPAPNVAAQLDVGYGGLAIELDFNFDDFEPFNALAGDTDGVGHFRAKNNTGVVQRNMLTTDCAGSDCCVGYDFPCSE